MAHKVAILSDIHSNSEALNQVFSDLGVNTPNPKVDEVIFLGDLLSYGGEPNEVIEQMSYLAGRIETQFITGNHDALYFDCNFRSAEYYLRLPEFIQEAIDWTSRNLVYDLKEEFNWCWEVEKYDSLFAHANPYGMADWRYIRTIDEAKLAAGVLADRGLKNGFFGHVHRKMEERFYIGSSSIDIAEVAVFNVGSIGQPRGGKSSYGLLEVDLGEIRYKNIEFDYDVSQAIKRINNSGMSRETVSRLVGYLI